MPRCNDSRHRTVWGRRVRRAEPLESRRLLFNSGPHFDLTAEALAVLDADVVADINDEHLQVDTLGQFNQLKHFDGSHFEEGSRRVNRLYRQILRETDPAQFDSGEAADTFGKILHAIQDFYAHSNWVDLADAGLLRSDALVQYGAGMWDVLTPYARRSGTRIVQGDSEQPLGPGSLLERDGYVVMVFDGHASYPGVISGSVLPVLYGPDHTPDSVAVSHGGIAGNPALPGALAKDDAEAPLFVEAVAAARAQTQHELFRLIRLIERRHGTAEHLIDAWVPQENREALQALLIAEAAREPDQVPPVVLSVQTKPGAAGTPGALDIAFSEPITWLDARLPQSYELDYAGADGRFNTPDDVRVTLVPQFAAGGSSVRLTVAGVGLVTGEYRLRVGAWWQFRDLAGVQLDGDANGMSGGIYETVFTVADPGARALANSLAWRSAERSPSGAQAEISGTTSASVATPAEVPSPVQTLPRRETLPAPITAGWRGAILSGPSRAIRERLFAQASRADWLDGFEHGLG